MPPRNPARSLFGEEALADRVAYERERRGWSYEGLAKRMTDVGCAINQSAIYKIEKGQPRRRITVDELVALQRVLEIPFDLLLLPPELAATQQLAELLRDWEKADASAQAADQALHETFQRLHAYVHANSDVTGGLPDLIRQLAERRFGAERRDEESDRLLRKIGYRSTGTDAAVGGAAHG